jgi:hypothetical protein
MEANLVLQMRYDKGNEEKLKAGRTFVGTGEAIYGGDILCQ